ncbi:gamma-glutamylcyclotransferase family protein [Streptomyces crystallinus]|uniref:Gamma-glutamylcyclotransferase AIG2-like domain-containing protein n=1 Tax=Streptomyces crystallinus TaxID=68191 RepID=A0ABN1GYI3_9ACTN
MTTSAPGASEAGPPFFVYGTLRPGERYHLRLLRGRTASEAPARLPGAVLYAGPGYPYATEGDGVVTGALITPRPEAYGEVLRVLDQLEECHGPDDPRNMYDRVERTVELPGGETARAWVYLAAAPLARELRAHGTPLPGGDWLTARRPAPAPPRSPSARGSADRA